MNEKEPGRWLAIWTNDRERHAWELPYFGAVQDGLFFHDGGFAHMPYSDSYTTLKDYGEMTCEEWDNRGGNDRFYADFPPVASPAEEYSQLVEAWISPDGELYICAAQQHELLAKRLTLHLGIKEPDTSLNRPGDQLLDRGWVKIYWDKVFLLKGEYTQRQLDILFDILLVLKNQVPADELIYSIRSELRYATRFGGNYPETEEDNIK